MEQLAEQLASILEIGKRVIIGAREHNSERQYISRIADVTGDTFAVTMPIEQKVLHRFEPGTHLTIYASDLAAMYALPTKVIADQIEPVALVILSSPTEVLRIQRRQFVRMDVHFGPLEMIITLVEQSQSPWTISSIIINISAGGMRFVCKEEITPSSQAKAILDLPLGFGRIEITGLVLRVESKGEGKARLWEASAQFVNLAEKDRDRITQYIFRQQSDLRKRGLL